MLIRSRAPVRIDFAGGWTDVALFAQDSPGYVVNAALNIYSYATLNVGADADLQDRSVHIFSSDFGLNVEAENIQKLEYDGNIDLAKAAIKKMGLQSRVDLITQSTAPPGSGLGTSASMGVALISCLSVMAGRPMLKYEMAEMASEIEREELGILGGKQDHYASALGGVQFMEFRGEEVKTSLLPLKRDTALELEKNLLLGYTGKSRLSGDIHARVTEAWKSGETSTRQAIAKLKAIARQMKEALMQGDLDAFAGLMQENWEQQKQLHPSVTNVQIEKLFEIAIEAGAVGGKACGAGGGGCILFYCRPHRHHEVEKALEEEGVQIIDFNLDRDGAQSWEP
jgi:D-glycero-alpha-D-manno-heptose-7-phosphate kinase